jgi:DNA (cytosine-5)-methyltransferase 1
MKYVVGGIFAGAGGLDLGFELAGFGHALVGDIDSWAVQTLRLNRPSWRTSQLDVRSLEIPASHGIDVLLAGVPCQGFSLGGQRRETDQRNLLYKEVIRLAKQARPRVVVIENVLNLRTMCSPQTGKPFATQIASDLENAGYQVFFDIFKMCHFRVPQTRRRFVFVAFRERPPVGYTLPQPEGITPIRPFLYDLAQETSQPSLPNHDPQWGFRSFVHVETGKPYSRDEEVVPVRFSRTASDGYPIRSFDEPFPAVDTATVWGWAQGNVRAKRVVKDRQNGKHIRNPDATVTLWRIQASRLRGFTHREYARLQTFPDNWKFLGENKRHVHSQIGNAVPVEFARILGTNIHSALKCIDAGGEFKHPGPHGGLEIQCQ